jgi:hypothetical protein
MGRSPRRVRFASLASYLPASCLMLALTASPSAWARSEVEVGYSRVQVFSAALRYLRVDLGYEVTEKDADAAYLLFNFTDPELQKKTAHGSIEVVQRTHTVRLLVSLPDLPSYREDVLKRGLLDKLRTEYGEPAPEENPDKPPAKKPDPDPKPPAGDSHDDKPPGDSSGAG